VYIFSIIFSPPKLIYIHLYKNIKQYFVKSFFQSASFFPLIDFSEKWLYGHFKGVLSENEGGAVIDRRIAIVLSGLVLA